MSSISISSSAGGGGGGGDTSTGGANSTTGSVTSSQISIITDSYINPRVHFSDSIEDDQCAFNSGQWQTSTFPSNQNSEFVSNVGSSTTGTNINYDYRPRAASSAAGTIHAEYEPQETVRYSPHYLCPQEGFISSMSRSSPSSPAGSNISIVGSLNTCKSKLGSCSPGPSWKIRNTRFSKRRGQERSTDRERQPSVCSDSETDSISGGMVIEELYLSTPTTKKWSLPLPIVTRSSESDSASSSWSARSADEATEDERSPIPSPSASTHSGDVDYYGGLDQTVGSSTSYVPEPSSNSLKTIEMETRKLAIKAKQTEEFAYHTKNVQRIAIETSDSHMNASGDDETPSRGGVTEKSSKDKSKKQRKKRSRAAESHRFQRMKTTNYGRCKICDAYVYFWGLECNQCQLICHKKCVKKMAIMCPKAPLPPRCGILNIDLESLPNEEKVPVLVIKCTNEIERRSITRPGIYRMAGVVSRVEKLLKSFESGPHLIDLSDVNANDLTSVLKIYLRELKDPLISNNIYKEIIDIGRIYRCDEQLAIDCMDSEPFTDMIKKCRVAVSKLASHRYATLRHMMLHLNQVASCHELNNMTAGALGIIFAPTIFRPRDNINDLFVEVFEAAPQARVIELLIRYADTIFEAEHSDMVAKVLKECSTPENENENNILDDDDEYQYGSSKGAMYQRSPPLSPNPNTISSELNLFSNTNVTASIGGTLCGQYYSKCNTSSTMASRHNQVRRTSSSSSASPSPGAMTASASTSASHHHHHHHHHHQHQHHRHQHRPKSPHQSTAESPHHEGLSASTSTFTFD